MKITIINKDKSVYVNEKSYSNLPLLTVPSNVHALQWNINQGCIEYNDGKQNEFISELPTWANDAKTDWDIADNNNNNNIKLQLEQITNDPVEPFKQLLDTEKMVLVRDERNKRLLACDWTQLLDAPSSINKLEWASYRQALRDFPNTIIDLSSINNIIFPTPPKM